MVYDIINMMYCFNIIIVTNIRDCIIIPILNFIIQNIIDWLNVGVFFICLFTDWYHMAVGISRYIGMAQDRTCN